MKVEEVMTPMPQCCGFDTNLAEATELLWNKDCGVLPVVEGGKLAGIITDRDICNSRSVPAADSRKKYR